jgi:hypothetical protein
MLTEKNAHDAETSCAFSLGYNDRMDFFLPEEDEQQLPPAETRIRVLQAVPYPDGQRVRVHLQITPFQVRPHIEVALVDADGIEVAAASIVEPVSWKLELTMHLRGASANPFTVEAHLSYADGQEAPPVAAVFEVHPNSENTFS